MTFFLNWFRPSPPSPPPGALTTHSTESADSPPTPPSEDTFVPDPANPANVATASSGVGSLAPPREYDASSNISFRGRIPETCPETKQALLELSDPSTLQGLEDFEKRIEQIDQIFLNTQDPRGVFTSLYRVITNKAAESVRAGQYQDNDWGAELTVDFGKRYLENLYAHLQGSRVDAGWKRYYDLADNPNVDLKRVVAMGATIHLVVDLPASLAAIDSSPQRREDFMQFGNILLEDYPEMIAASQHGHQVDMSDLFDLYFAGDLIDARHGEGTATRFGFQTIRNKAWTFGQWLQDNRRLAADVEITISWRTIDGILAGMDAANLL